MTGILDSLGFTPCSRHQTLNQDLMEEFAFKIKAPVDASKVDRPNIATALLSITRISAETSPDLDEGTGLGRGYLVFVVTLVEVPLSGLSGWKTRVSLDN